MNQTTRRMTRQELDDHYRQSLSEAKALLAQAIREKNILAIRKLKARIRAIQFQYRYKVKNLHLHRFIPGSTYMKRRLVTGNNTMFDNLD